MVPDERTGGPRFAAFCERFVRHTKGRWQGKPFVLEPWQREFWWEALEVDPATGLRVYTEVGLGPAAEERQVAASPRPSAHYFLSADGEAEPEVYVAAAARGQAGIVLGQARRMALQSPPLRRLPAGPDAPAREPPQRRASCARSSADAALQHGLNPSANIIDELHAHRDGALYTALTTGTLAREQPFTLWITTAGARDSFLGEMYAIIETGAGARGPRHPAHLPRPRQRHRSSGGTARPTTPTSRTPTSGGRPTPPPGSRTGSELGKEYARLRARGALTEWRTYHLDQFVGCSRAGCPTRTGAPAPATCACGPTSRCTPACGSPTTTAPRPWQPPSARASASSSRCARSRHPRASTCGRRDRAAPA